MKRQRAPDLFILEDTALHSQSVPRASGPLQSQYWLMVSTRPWPSLPLGWYWAGSQAAFTLQQWLPRGQPGTLGVILRAYSLGYSLRLWLPRKPRGFICLVGFCLFVSLPLLVKREAGRKVSSMAVMESGTESTCWREPLSLLPLLLAARAPSSSSPWGIGRPDASANEKTQWWQKDVWPDIKTHRKL